MKSGGTFRGPEEGGEIEIGSRGHGLTVIYKGRFGGISGR